MRPWYARFDFLTRPCYFAREREITFISRVSERLRLPEARFHQVSKSVHGVVTGGILRGDFRDLAFD